MDVKFNIKEWNCCVKNKSTRVRRKGRWAEQYSLAHKNSSILFQRQVSLFHANSWWQQSLHKRVQTPNRLQAKDE
jgi:hypothetical protein